MSHLSQNGSGQAQFAETRTFFSELDQLLRGKKVEAPSPALMPYSKQQCVYLLNSRTRELVSAVGVEGMLGYRADEFDFHSLVNYVHPDDVDTLTSVREAVLEYMSHNAEVKELTLSITYRIRKKNGNYIKVLKQMSISRQADDPLTMYHNILLTDISFMKSGSQVEWTFDAPNLNPEDVRMYVPQNSVKFFSTREQEVLELIDKGYTSHEIAKALFISKHTVDTHRRKMLQKTGCANAIALLEFYRSQIL